MKRIALIAALVVGTASLVGCSADSSKVPAASATTSTTSGKLTVQGTVSSKLGTDNARAIAIGANGKQIWTYLDAHGDFTLKLPNGTSYRVLIANTLASGAQDKVIGKLALPTGNTNSQWIKADKVQTVDLGVLRKPTTTTSTTSTSSTTAAKSHIAKIACEGCGSSSNSYGDDDDDNYGSTSSGSGSSDGDWMGSGYGGGDWGDGYCDDGYGDGYSYDDGGWDDSASGWDDGSSSDDSFDPNHDDDNGCYGDTDDDDDDDSAGDDDDSWGGSGSGGSSSSSSSSSDDDDDGAWAKDPGKFCDVCSGGADAVILAPSNSDCGSFADTLTKITSTQESATCSQQSSSGDDDDDSSSSSSSSYGGESLAGSSSASLSKAIGDSCSVKAQCGANICVAGKCAAPSN